MQYLEIAISKRAMYGIQDSDLMRLFWRDAMRTGGIDPDKPWTQEELPDRYVIRQEVIAPSPNTVPMRWKRRQKENKMADNCGQIGIRNNLADATREELLEIIVQLDGQQSDGRMTWGSHYFAADHRVRRLEQLLSSRYHNEHELNRALHVADLEAANKRLRSEIRMMQEAAERHNLEAFATGLIVHCTGCEAGAPANANQLTEEKVCMVESIAQRLRAWWSNHQRRAATTGYDTPGTSPDQR